MKKPTRQQLEDTGVVLGLIRYNDPGFPKPDNGMVIAWAQVFAVHDLNRNDLTDAVIALFADDTRPRDRILAADVIKRARNIRRERAEREKSGQITEQPQQLSPTRQAINACNLCDPNGWIEINDLVHKCEHSHTEQLTA